MRNQFLTSMCQRKSSQNFFTTIGRKQAKKPLELVHSDVWGKISTPSLGGGIYFLIFINDNSHHVWTNILKSKDQVLLLALSEKFQVKGMGELH